MDRTGFTERARQPSSSPIVAVLTAVIGRVRHIREGGHLGEEVGGGTPMAMTPGARSRTHPCGVSAIQGLARANSPKYVVPFVPMDQAGIAAVTASTFAVRLQSAVSEYSSPKLTTMPSTCRQSGRVNRRSSSITNPSRSLDAIGAALFTGGRDALSTAAVDVA